LADDTGISRKVVAITNPFIPLFKKGISSSNLIIFLIDELLGATLFQKLLRQHKLHILKVIADIHCYNPTIEVCMLISTTMQNILCSLLPDEALSDLTSNPDFQILGFISM
jgi:hypothetical protein